MPAKNNPYLFRFKKECLSPKRIKANECFYYDQRLAEVMTTEGNHAKPLIEMEKYNGAVTKKADIEKGEDQKDRWMWT